MKTVKISAVGDILMWEKQIQAALKAKNTYSFDYIFKDVAPYLKHADITIGNLETTFSGRELRYQTKHPHRNWPKFNCPDELAGTLKKARFDVLTTANNHCLDRGDVGLQRTLDILDQNKIKHTGTYRSKRESTKDLIVDVNGMKIGILAYTYGTNRHPIPKDKPWAVNVIGKEMLKRIYAVKKKVDLTIVSLHFGYEFKQFPCRAQRVWAQRCFEHGADIILGAHPHVIQPMKTKWVKDMDGISKNRFVIYSLGNFTSKRMRKNIDTTTGLILNLKLSGNDKGDLGIKGIEYIPTWVQQKDLTRKGFYKLLPMSYYLKHEKNSLEDAELLAMKKAWSHTINHLGGKAL